LEVAAGGVRAVNRALDDEIEVLFRAARTEGRRESRAAYAADALGNLVLRGPSKPPEVKLTVDQAAVTRGYVEPGERCEIDGYGPVPVAVARSLSQDALVALLARGADGDVVVSARAKRTIPRGLRRQLEHRYPVCVNCGGDGPLEIDHIVPIEHGGETSDENTSRLCRHCHRLKTNFGWRAEAIDGSRRELVRPRAGAP
jgi:5-methylcytosine-specific restriction endonuclease McrA